MRARLLGFARVVLARPRMQWLARLLFDLSLRGLGILNYGNAEQTGERDVLRRLALAVEAGAVNSTALHVLDVGANEGDYAAECLALLRSVELHLFEPHPATADRLRRRFDEGVRVTQAAVGATGGTAELFDYIDTDGSSHASLLADVITGLHGRPSASVAVPMMRIDDYAAGLAGDVLLLKIDTEGSELEVLRGATQSLGSGRIHCVQFEFNAMNVISRALLRDFAELLPGYSLYRLLPRGLAPIHAEPLDEIFAFQNILAVRPASSVRSYLRV